MAKFILPIFFVTLIVPTHAKPPVSPTQDQESFVCGSIVRYFIRNTSYATVHYVVETRPLSSGVDQATPQSVYAEVQGHGYGSFIETYSKNKEAVCFAGIQGAISTENINRASVAYRYSEERKGW